MVRVPRKNISRRIVDIFSPFSQDEDDEEKPDGEELASLGAHIDSESPLSGTPHHSMHIGRFIAVFVLLAFAGIIFLGVRAFRERSGVIGEAVSRLDELHGIIPDAANFDFESARDKLASSSAGIAGYLDRLTSLGAGAPQQVLEAFKKVFGDTSAFSKDFADLSTRAVSLLSSLATLRDTGTHLFFSGHGPEFLSLLSSIRDDLGRVADVSTRLQGAFGGVPGILPVGSADYLSFQVGVTRAKNMLDETISWLGADERHVAIFFLNPAEMRPGGGFLGAYADLTLRRGAIASIDVHDVNDPDREFVPVIVPPKQLQGIVRRWRAADANWFFDFASSSEKTLSFFEQSVFYAKDGRRFDGAVAVTPRVASDLLALVGPVTVTSTKRTVTKDNLLFEIQRDVQSGLSAKTSSPKAILATLTATIRDRLFASSSRAMMSGTTTLAMARTWLEERDIVFYARDKAMQSIFESLDASGRLSILPATTNGDFFALAHASIGSDKSDLFVENSVLFQSRIDGSGAVANHVEITRSHRGKTATDWWYKTKNSDYLELFVSSDAQLTNVSGTTQKSVTPLTSYAKGYTTDPDLVAFEGTAEASPFFSGIDILRASGRKIFAGWLVTPLGATSTAVFDYTHRMFTPPETGGTYTFTFDKQINASGTYRFEFSAPVGYRWKENGLPIYEYVTDDVPGRLLLNLTFEQVL